MNLPRRDFLKGSLSALGFAALGGGPLLAAPLGWKHRGKANLVFGVLADTHFRADGDWRRGLKSDRFFVADWVMPVGKTPHPFAKEELKKIIGEPQFSKSGKLRVESVKLEGTDEAVRLSIPLADGNPDSRVYAYEVVVVGRDDPIAPQTGESGGTGSCRPPNFSRPCMPSDATWASATSRTAA